jgi:amino acid adenylation domain-containing protein
VTGETLEVPPVCAHELFERQAAQTPDAVAVVHGERTLTYRELNERANQVAHFLRRRGVGPDVLVGVSLERCPELVIGLLGVWKAGGAYVPLDPAYPADRLAFMVEDSGARTLLVAEACRHLFTSVQDRLVCLDSEWSRVAGEATSNPEVQSTPQNLAYVMYTSGSTGRPKGAMILHGGLVNYLSWAIQAYGVVAGGSVPVHSSVSFDLTVTSLYPALLSGGSVELLPEDVGAQALVAALRRGQARNLVKITPAHLDLLTQALGPREVRGRTRLFVIGGENLTAESLQVWRDHAPEARLVNEYGPTETVVGCCIHEVGPNDSRHGSIPIGRPIANTRLYVLDADLKPVPPGGMGELYIGGAGVARGYYNRPDLTQERFLPDPFADGEGARMYKSGDLARLREDGVLEYLGRADDQVKVRGYRIELGEIEAALAGHPAVQACAVLAREDSPGDKQLVGYVVPHEGDCPSAADLRAHLAVRLPEYMVPARFVMMASFPLTQNGKVDRRALPAPEADAGPARDVAAPRNEVEKTLAVIWAELLNVKAVGVRDDFFDLGGHSLLALKALARIREALDVDLSPDALFDSPTVEGLAALVAEAKGTHAAPGAPSAEPGGREPRRRIEPRKKDAPIPLSSAQEQLWYLDRLVPGSPAYNVVDVITLEGPYDRAALHRSFDELLARHEALRSAFPAAADGTPVQRVEKEVAFDLPEVDLSARSPRDRESAWHRLVREVGRAPFDLSRAPLLRAVVAHASEREHRVLVTIHHVIADEWSLEVLQSELRQLYAAFTAGRPSPLAPLLVQYGDFASWQRGQLQSDALKAHEDYWRAELAGAPTVLSLPADKPRPPTPTFRGAVELFAVPKPALQRLQAIAREEDATLFMVLEAAFAALLHRTSGQPDLLVGTPISCRSQAGTEHQVGYFLNTIVLRSQLTDGLTFRGLLSQARTRARGAYGHPDLPFDQLVAALAPERDASRTPLFQAMFVLHDRDGTSMIRRLEEQKHLETGTSKFDLTLYTSENEAGLEGLLEYSTDLFEAETAREMCAHYATILEAIAANPGRLVAELPLVPEAERRRLVAEWNDTAAGYVGGDARLHELFERQAARSADGVAALHGAESITYGALDRRADQLAKHLVSLGVGPDVLVGVMLERSLDVLVTLLGILKAGGAYVPLDPTFPPERLSAMVEDSGMPVLVTHRGLDRALGARPPVVVQLDADAAAITARGAGRANAPRPGAESLAYLLYTSGSTGKPKGVAIPHRAVVNLLLSMQREPGMRESETLLAVTTLSFDIAGVELFLPLLTGAKVVLAGRDDAVDPARLMDRIRESACTILQATPATWRALLQAGWGGTKGLRVFCGGEAMTPELAEALLSRSAEVWNMYGPTETTVYSVIHRVTAVEPNTPIGRPISNTQVYVLDDRRQLVPEGALGELYIGGDGLARGYLNRPDLTADRFVESPFTAGARLYRTGDLARWRHDGVLEHHGRTDHQLKVRGYRIEPGDIEAAIAKHPSVRQSVVVAREDTPGDRRLVAYVVADHEEASLQSELRSHLRAQLPEYMVPQHVVRLDAMPLTPTGKVDRKALPPPRSQARTEPVIEKLAPRDDVEATIARVWEEVLGAPVASVRESFFDLGGHSLLAVRLFSRIEKATGVALPLATLIEAPTIERIARRIREKRGDVAGSFATAAAPSPSPAAAREHPSLVRIRSGGEHPAFFCVHGAGGNVLNLQEIARYMTADRAFYGFQARGVEGVFRPHESIENIASDYLAELRDVQPHGAYFLAGYCGGGLVAYEMARRLLAAGETVAFLGLIDLYRPGVPTASTRMQNWTRALTERPLKETLRTAASKLRESVQEQSAELRLRLHLARGETVPYELRDRWLTDSLREAGAHYKLEPYPGTLTVFRAREGNLGENGRPLLQDPGPDLGWSVLAPGRVDAHEAPGDHHSLVRPPNVQVLAAQIEESLNQAERRAHAA